MDTNRIEVFKQFAKYLEYPMVVFEAETGNVLDINYEAEVLLGGKIVNISMEPGRVYTKLDFWEVLHGKKCVIWHRIRLVADGREFLVSGLVNETTENDTQIYTILFQCRSDLNIGSITLERIVEHAGVVAVNMSKTEDGFQVEYVSRNINQYGYSRGQLYDKVLHIREIVCVEDQERLRVTVGEAIAKHDSEGVFECRILTEMRELIPVRVLLQYIYNDSGDLTDVELLVFDLRDEYRKNQEKTYLSNAISKMKSVVMVKTYQAGQRTLRYISPNANMVGMNVEALRKGYKLTEDYIHPEDRENVMNAIYQAVANEITDYVQEYRMVRDDGKQIWVENEVTIHRVSDGEAEISFLITDITQRKVMEKELALTLDEETEMETGTVGHSLDMIIIDDNDIDMLQEFQTMADAFGKNANYYSVVLNAEGKLLTKPAGPVSDIGRFYDIFERPQLKEEFVTMSTWVKEHRIPHSTTFDMDGKPVHTVFAPLILKENVVAYWVLTSFHKEGAEILGEVVEAQWRLANSIVNHFYLQDIVRKETKAHKVTELHLHKEQMEHRVVEEVITSMSRKGEAAFGEMCHKIGIYLSVENIAIYLKNKDSDKVEKYYVWNHSGENSLFAERMILSQAEYGELKAQFGAEPMLIANYQETEPFLKELVRKTNQSMMLCPLSISPETEGYLVFADCDRNREYDDIDRHFVTTITKILESAIANRQKQVVPDLIRTGLIESYDHIRDAVYVRDNQSGEIVFANKAMDKLFGYSVVGRQSTNVLPDTMGKFRNIGEVHKHFIVDKKIIKWQTYVKELDQIMNIVEVRMEKLYGADWSIVILKKNKDKKKGKE